MSAGATSAAPAPSGPAARRRFCLVTPMHVADNPRLVKEADALAAAGCDVRVVSMLWSDAGRARDVELLRGRGWRLTSLDVRPASLGTRLRRIAGGAAERAARHASARGAEWPWLVDRAASRHLGALARLAAAEPADVVIAHNLQALPVAARAARLLGARLGFDAEDLHAAEAPETPLERPRLRLNRLVEQRYLPCCDLVTASSEGIADELARRYRIARPLVVLNAFPLADLPAPAPRRAAGRVPSLYWFSQVIGPDRGLEDAIEAMPLLGAPVQLHLRGRIDPDYRRRLQELAAARGVADALRFLPVEAPARLPALAAQHDIGLALEQPVCLNRLICVTNKLFMYLLGGLAVAATDTPGQRGIIAEAGDVGFVYPAGDAAALAAGLRPLVTDPARLAAVQRRARAAAEARFSWEHEAPRLVAYLTGAPAVLAPEAAGAPVAQGVA